MKHPDLHSAIDELGQTITDLAAFLEISEYEACELIQNEASGEITVVDHWVVYGASGRDLLIFQSTTCRWSAQPRASALAIAPNHRGSQEAVHPSRPDAKAEAWQHTPKMRCQASASIECRSAPNAHPHQLTP